MQSVYDYLAHALEHQHPAENETPPHEVAFFLYEVASPMRFLQDKILVPVTGFYEPAGDSKNAGFYELVTEQLSVFGTSVQIDERVMKLLSTDASAEDCVIKKPSFIVGPVIAGAHYVVMDAKVSSGSTLMAFVNYIHAHGGIVDGVLSPEKKASYERFMPPSTESINQLAEVLAETGNASQLVWDGLCDALRNRNLDFDTISTPQVYRLARELRHAFQTVPHFLTNPSAYIQANIIDQTALQIPVLDRQDQEELIERMGYNSQELTPSPPYSRGMSSEQAPPRR